MSDLIIIYLLIGLAHWAAHILGCDGCKRSVVDSVVMFLEGMIHVFSWPFHLAKYSALIFGKGAPDALPAERIRVDAMSVNGGSTESVVELEQREGESKAEFHRRVNEAIDYYVEQRKNRAPK